MSNKLPEPKKATESLTVALPVEVVSASTPAEEIRKVAASLHVAVLSKSVLGELKQVGAELDAAGVIQVGNQMVYVTAQSLLKSVLLITEKNVTAEDAIRTHQPLVALAKALNTLVGGMTEDVLEKGGQAPVASKGKAFPGGAPAKLTQINFHAAPAPAPPAEQKG